MQKAKSRLSPKIGKAAVRKKRVRPPVSKNPAVGKPAIRKIAGSKKSEKYLKFLPLLLVSMLLYLSIFWLVANIYPNEIANVLFPNSYLPFTLLLFFANLLFFSYLMLNTRRGLILSLVIAILVFFRLQRVIFEWSWTAPLLGSAAIFEFLANRVNNRFRHQ